MMLLIISFFRRNFLALPLWKSLQRIQVKDELSSYKSDRIMWERENLHAIHHANLVFGGCGVGENKTFIFRLLADVATAGETFKWKASQTALASLQRKALKTAFDSLQEGMSPTSSQTSGLFLSDRNFSTTGSLFSSAAFRNLGTSTGSV